MVVVDGRQPGYSVGMTNFELAQTLVRLGAVTAAGLDAGGSSTMAFDGALLNQPSDPGGERAVSEGLFVLYTGVVAAPPGEPVLSPNGDGAGDVQPLSYKLARPSNVTVSLIGPDRVGARDRRGRQGGRRPALLLGRDERRRHACRRGPVAPLGDGDRRERSRRRPPTASSRSTGRSAGSPCRPASSGSGAAARSTRRSRSRGRRRVTGTLRTLNGAVVATFARAVAAPAGPRDVALERPGRHVAGVPSARYVRADPAP